MRSIFENLEISIQDKWHFMDYKNYKGYIYLKLLRSAVISGNATLIFYWYYPKTENEDTFYVQKLRKLYSMFQADTTKDPEFFKELDRKYLKYRLRS
jgi:hypothetical protein